MDTQAHTKYCSPHAHALKNVNIPEDMKSTFMLITTQHASWYEAPSFPSYILPLKSCILQF